MTDLVRESRQKMSCQPSLFLSLAFAHGAGVDDAGAALAGVADTTMAPLEVTSLTWV